MLDENFQPAHFKAGRGEIFGKGEALLDAGEPADIRHVAFANQPGGGDAAVLQVTDGVEHALTHQAVDVERILDVVDSQFSPQGDAFGRDDVAQLFPFEAAGFDVAFGDEPFEVPVDGADGDPELIRQSCLAGIRIDLDLFQNIEVAGVFGVKGRINIQPLNYKTQRQKGQGESGGSGEIWRRCAASAIFS